MSCLVRTKMNSLSVFWFRRDLRLEDNIGLFYALSGQHPVLPIFIFDPNILKQLPIDDTRVTFIYDQIQNINKQLKQVGGTILVHHTEPLEVFKKLVTEYDIKAVYANHDYEPYGNKRDTQITQFLNSRNIQFKTYKDHVIFEKEEILKPDGSPYKVYTPYSKRWLALYKTNVSRSLPSEKLISNIVSTCFDPPTLKEIGFEHSNQQIEVYSISRALISNYKSQRDFPAIAGTSRLGPHLRFGTVSIRKIVAEAVRNSNTSFLKELIWREFFMQILWYFPHTVTHSFKPQYDSIKWRNNEKEFKRWCNGNTGYPIVDAGMRELNITGYMHNRVRMIVGSFLCKHLLIDWRWGEAYFAKKLNDYEMASNIGNWQWVAGCGVDAAPYFRIFNPTSQTQKYDKQMSYIKKWVPEFREPAYPSPMVAHKFARERCLKTYREALNNY